MAIEELLLSSPAELWKTAQAVVFDWYDGPREGVAALAFPECEFAFELVEERHNPDGLDDRLFRLRELPVGSVQTVLRALSRLGEPSKPAWAPVWSFATETERREADRTIDMILAGARETGLAVLSRDMERFEGVWVIGEGQPSQIDWFDALKIP
jgi:hypothetical protein